MAENFTALNAVLSGTNVVLSWSTFGPVGPVTAVAIQRSPFGSNAFVTIGTTSASLPGTFTDTAPGTGEYSYRLAVTVTQGGVDAAGTLLYSNTANISNAAVTGVVVLTGTVNVPSGPVSGPQGYRSISLTWTVDNSGANDDVISSEVQRSLDGGTHWRHAGEQDEFGPQAFTELLQAGTGSVSYRVLVSLPNANADQLNSPKISTSNVVTLTV